MSMCASTIVEFASKTIYFDCDLAYNLQEFNSFGFDVMLKVTLPDGSVQEHARSATVLAVAQNISLSLAKAAVAGEVDGELVDLGHQLTTDSPVRIITAKDPEGLEVIRHSCAHLLAQAVKQLYPEAQVTIGPVIDNGFYYDFAYDRGFTPDDLQALEQRMHKIAKQKLEVTRQNMSRDQAIQYFTNIGELYKAEIIRDLDSEQVSLYTQGEFTDLCRGPHVPHTGFIKAFKLLSVAGAYWRGDANNAMLQRIYGTAWANKDDLNNYLHLLAEAEKRDHRKIAKQLDLFHLQEQAPGMVFWHGKGWQIWQVVEQFMRSSAIKFGYSEIKTPQLLNRSLWEQSGHWQKFADEMYTTTSKEDRIYAVKPMSCPGHVQVFNQGITSYRQLPVRLFEFGAVHRDEPSGALHGLMRVRALTQDDGHIFCTSAQIQQEVGSVIDQAYETYHAFGFDQIAIKLATRPEERIGSDEVWDKAESALATALTDKGITFMTLPGEGAFYGPKIEFHLEDCLGRSWQCATIQLDFAMPERLGATYIAEDNSRQTPVMIHRAIVGSMERFIGILLEHFAGKMPPWLAPIQVNIMNVTDNQQNYCQQLAQKLRHSGFRVGCDLRNEKIGFKIREATLQKIPYLLVVGEREVAGQTVAVRTQGGQDLGSMTLVEFSELLTDKIAQLGQANVEE